jgi:hypothetical protein
MAALAERPTPPVVELCLALADDPVFVAEGDRKRFVLDLLGAVRPMNEPTVAIFQKANGQGYFARNARLLAANGSPRALALFESMMLDTNVPAENRIESLHNGIVPRRTQLTFLRSADRILAATSEPSIAIGVIESVFDYRQEWFGIESGISRPAGWQTASAESAKAALSLASKALARRDLAPALRASVTRARATLTARGR